MPDHGVDVLDRCAEVADEIERAYKKAHEHAGQQLARLDPTHPRTLVLTVNSLLKAHFDQKELAQLLGVSRTTVGRWAQDQNIPRSPAFRKWAVEELTKVLQVRKVS